MEQLLERARAYLDALEAERQMALALSKQKAQEAELIKARQEGFQAAIDMVGAKLLPVMPGQIANPKSQLNVALVGRYAK